MSELVGDLLDLAKVEAGKVVVRPETFRAADLLSALRGMMRPLQTNDAVTLVFEDGTAAGELFTDEGKVAQVLRNLLSNALKFTEQGEVRVTVTRSAAGSNPTRPPLACPCCTFPPPWSDRRTGCRVWKAGPTPT